MKKIVGKKCEKCGHIKTKTNCFCDSCKKEIDYDGWNNWKHKDYLELTLREEWEYEHDEFETRQFCSWTCLFNWIKTNDINRFDVVEFPELQNEHMKEFYRCLGNES